MIRDEDPHLLATTRENRGEPDAIFLQLRQDSEPPIAEATECFDAIIARLSAHYGEPAVPWNMRATTRNLLRGSLRFRLGAWMLGAPMLLQRLGYGQLV